MGQKIFQSAIGGLAKNSESKICQPIHEIEEEPPKRITAAQSRMKIKPPKPIPEGMLRFYTQLGQELGEVDCARLNEISAEHKQILKNCNKHIFYQFSKLLKFSMAEVIP